MTAQLPTDPVDQTVTGEPTSFCLYSVAVPADRGRITLTMRAVGEVDSNASPDWQIVRHCGKYWRFHSLNLASRLVACLGNVQVEQIR